MPGLLAFTLALNNQQFKQSMSVSTAEQRKFSESIKEATARLKQEYGVMANPPKPVPAPDPAPIERHAQSLRHMRHELALVSEVAGQFGTELGALGRLAGLAFSPWLLAIGAVSLAVELLKARWQKLHESMVETLRAMQTIANTRLEAQANAMNAAAAANAAFALSLNHSADALDRETRAMENRIAQFHAMTDAQNRVLHAQERARLAQIDTASAGGLMTPSQSLAARQAVEMETRRREYANDNAAAAQEIQQREERLNQARQRLQTEETNHANAVEAARPHHEAVESQRGIVADMEHQRDQYQEQAREARATLADLDRLGMRHSSVLYQRQQGITQDAESYATNASGTLLQGQRHLADLERENQYYDAAVRQAATRAEIEQGIVNTSGQELEQLRAMQTIRQREQTETLRAMEVENQARQERLLMEARASEIARLNGRTSIERMGFHFFGGGPTSAMDHMSRVARATEQSANFLGNIVRLLSTGDGGGMLRPALTQMFNNGHP